MHCACICWKIKSSRCLLSREISVYATVSNLFVDVVNVFCMGRNTYTPVILKTSGYYVLLQLMLFWVYSFRCNNIVLNMKLGTSET